MSAQSKRPHHEDETDFASASKRVRQDNDASPLTDSNQYTMTIASAASTTHVGPSESTFLGQVKIAVNPTYEAPAFLEHARALLSDDCAFVVDALDGHQVARGCSTDEAMRAVAATQTNARAVGLAWPFHCCSLPLFLMTVNSDARETETGNSGPTDVAAGQPIDAYLRTLASDLARQPLRRKNNDLYNFEQSDDLKNMDATATCSLRPIMEALHGPVRALLARITGIGLNTNVAMTFSSYGQSGESPV